MVRIIFTILLSGLLFAQKGDVVAAGPVQDGLRLSIAIAGNQPPSAVRLIIESQGNSRKLLTVGVNNHWRVEAKLMTRDGREHDLVHLPRLFVNTGNIVPLTIEVLPQLPYQVDLPLSDFEFDEKPGSSIKLSTLIGSGDKLRLKLHCGPLKFKFVVGSQKQGAWTGDLVSGWLTL